MRLDSNDPQAKSVRFLLRLNQSMFVVAFGTIGMSVSQARRVRNWVVTIVVAAYALVILAPTLAFSLENNVSIVHSMTEGHGGFLFLHLHHDDADHQLPDKQGPHVGHHCCGGFALAGLSASDAVLDSNEGCAALVRAEPKDQCSLRRPGRLDRPPRNHSVI